jgi:hypothetical protein
MDLQTLIGGKFDPVAAIRLLAVRVAALEAQAEHSVFEGEISTEVPEVAGSDTAVATDGGEGGGAAAPVADVGDGDDADGAGKSAPKVAGPAPAAKKAGSTKKKAGG